MDSKRLSARLKQPGHDRTFTLSESNFAAAARAVLDRSMYEVSDHPRDLARIFPGLEGERELGVVPEASITSLRTGRKLFVEVKKQGARGNAEERACKHHTVQFYATLKALFGYDYHPFVTIFCEELATNPRYTRKAAFLFEPKQYLLWVNYEEGILRDYLNERCREWLDP
jgi:hypothetical protein